MKDQSLTRVVDRLRSGDHQALPDLLDALEREGDPRFAVLGERMQETMLAIRCYNEPADCVARWRALFLFAVRLMSPASDKISYRLKKGI